MRNAFKSPMQVKKLNRSIIFNAFQNIRHDQAMDQSRQPLSATPLANRKQNELAYILTVRYQTHVNIFLRKTFFTNIT